MPTSIHDIFTEQLVEEIKSQLKRVPCENEGTTAILNKIWSESTSDVYLYGHGSIEGRFPKRSPDASLAHADSQYPSLVIETSYSKRQKNLAQLANDYICGSDGNIAVILGFDIEYDSGSKRATVSIWRPQIAPDLEEEGAFVLETLNVQEADPFRIDDGTPVQGRSLQLQLSDFAPSRCLTNISPELQRSTVVEISYEQLSSFLHTAETRHWIKRMQRGVQATLPPNCKKRERENTPPEILSPRREAKIIKRETENTAKAEVEDPPWSD
ncbi:hypothetical protein MMC12_008475 [Toensbergia leucococca]|nr:hypothetical protein [Toensbergia leucococca]